MPNNRYRDLKWTSRVHDYPFTHAVAIGVGVSAMLLLLTLGVNPMGQYMILLLCLFAIPSAVLILVGLQWRGSTLTGHGVEATGHWLAIGAWLINAWLLVSLGAFTNIATPVVFIVAHALSARKLHVDNRKIKAIVREVANNEGGGQE